MLDLIASIRTTLVLRDKKITDIITRVKVADIFFIYIYNKCLH